MSLTRCIPLIIRLCQMLALSALCLLGRTALAQSSELETEEKLKASIAMVRSQVLPKHRGNRAPSGEKSLPSLLGSLSQLNNIDELCERGLGSERLCSTRSALIDAAIAASLPNPMILSMDLTRFPEGLGTSIAVALRKPENLTQSKTRANLIVSDLRAYTGHLDSRKLDARLYLRGFVGQLPSMAMASGLRGFKTLDEAAMVGALMADVTDALIDSVGVSLERCAPQDLKTIGKDRDWFSSPQAIAMSACVARVLGSSEATSQLHGIGQVFELPEQWMKQGLFQPEESKIFLQLAWLGRLMQTTEVVPVVNKKSGATVMGFSTPFKVADQACDTGNNYCRQLVGYNDEKARCTLASKALAPELCYRTAEALSLADSQLNAVVPVWPYAFDVIRAILGKPAQLDEVRQYTGMAASLSDNFARIAQEPQSSMVIKFKQVAVPGLLFDSQAWVVDSFTLRH